jgi:hypothetical protein
VKEAQDSAAAAIARAQEERIQEAGATRAAVELATARASMLELQLRDVREDLAHAREEVAQLTATQEQDRAAARAQVRTFCAFCLGSWWSGVSCARMWPRGMVWFGGMVWVGWAGLGWDGVSLERRLGGM